MSEAAIVRRGGGSGGQGELRTEIFTTNNTWKVPTSIKNNSIQVLIYGGGGSGGGSSA